MKRAQRAYRFLRQVSAANDRQVSAANDLLFSPGLH